MREGTTAILASLKRSRATSFDSTHFKDLIADLKEFGEKEFLTQVTDALAKSKSSRAPRVKSDLERYFLGSHRKTGLSRREFIDHVVKQILNDFGGSVLPKKQRTLPKFLEFYSSSLNEKQIIEAISSVAREHSLSR
ncbi:MAG: hypothetical protein AAFR90_15045 [Pseudomonadota bacterium]